MPSIHAGNATALHRHYRKLAQGAPALIEAAKVSAGAVNPHDFHGIGRRVLLGYRGAGIKAALSTAGNPAVQSLTH